MNIVKPYARLIVLNGETDLGGDNPGEPLGDSVGKRALRQIEFCGRISHRSEDAQTHDSFDRFIRAVVLQHGDWSIVEHVSATVDMLVDRGITHEVVRHRLFAFTQECISGDSRLTGCLTIKEAYERELVGKKIRSSDGSCIVLNRIAHIFHKGLQPVYQVVTKSGYRIKTTLAHEFQLPNGYFSRLDSIAAGDSVMVNGRPCLLAIDDQRLRTLFFVGGLSPAEIANQEQVPYSTVTRRLRQLGVFRDYRNDKNKGKYNCGRTEASVSKMRESVTSGYRQGRVVWNKGIKESQHPSVAKQAAGLRTHHYHYNPRGSANSNWKGGVRKTQRVESRRLKQNIKECEVCHSTKRLEVHHIDEIPAHNDISNLIKLCHACHRKVHSKFKLGIKPVADEVVSILYVGMEDVYDLEMQTHHNYVANGFIVHNSTRFVNYEKKMPPSFIVPNGIEEDDRIYGAWTNSIAQAEVSYHGMLQGGCTPQIARSVFPNALASRIIISGNLRNWRHFFLMRSTKEAHPQMREVVIPLLKQFQEVIPILYEDIEPEARQVDNLKKAR